MSKKKTNDLEKQIQNRENKDKSHTMTQMWGQRGWAGRMKNDLSQAGQHTVVLYTTLSHSDSNFRAQ